MKRAEQMCRRLSTASKSIARGPARQAGGAKNSGKSRGNAGILDGLLTPAERLAVGVSHDFFDKNDLSGTLVPGSIPAKPDDLSLFWLGASFRHDQSFDDLAADQVVDAPEGDICHVGMPDKNLFDLLAVHVEPGSDNKVLFQAG